MTLQTDMKIYLDVCCLNRPFDDQAQDRIRLETEAVYAILKNIELGRWKLLNSDIIFYETEKLSDITRKERINCILSLCDRHVELNAGIIERAQEIQLLGIKSYDALHIASAEAAKANIFLTTDDQLYKKAVQHKMDLYVRVENPLNWIIEVLHNESI